MFVLKGEIISSIGAVKEEEPKNFESIALSLKMTNFKKKLKLSKT